MYRIREGAELYKASSFLQANPLSHGSIAVIDLLLLAFFQRRFHQQQLNECHHQNQYHEI